MLHECGLAREYPISGMLESTLTWSKGDRFDIKLMDDIDLT